MSMLGVIGRPSPEAIHARGRSLYLASFSDVHLGHRKTPTAFIIQNLERYGFPYNAETAELDLIFLGGDLFDEGLSYFDEEVALIEGWMYRFLRFCSKHHIALRVLEGTASHDRGQNAHFEKIIELANIVIDFRYVKSVWVEQIEALGISVLYVPDYSSPDAGKIWELVEKALSEAGVSQVDYAVIHGAFKYQMPPIASVQAACHDMDRYLKVVKNYLFTGHIHVPRVYDRILNNGSFDRLAHGEEEDKGHWRVHVDKDGNDSVVFRVNKGAKLYKTIDLTGLSVDEAYERLKGVEDYPRDSAVRLVLGRDSPILTNLAKIKILYPHIEWTTKTLASEEVQKNLLVDLRSQFKEVVLTPTNAAEILLERLAKSQAPERVIHRAQSLLESYKDV